MEFFKIPLAVQIVMDDFGWFYGKNELAEGGPARTSICRDHTEEDYRVINELGRRLGMKIVCGFTLGEWDKDNRLRGMKHATPDEKGWDRKATVDMEAARRFFSLIEQSDYIDIAFHGLMHSFWVDGENHGNPREFYYYDLPEGAAERRLDYPCVPVSADYVDSHLKAWFDIYNGWGFSKPVKTFISPAGLHRDRQKVLDYAEKIKKYGILYWKNGWDGFTGFTEVFDGIIFLECGDDFLDFDAIDVDPDTLPPFHGRTAVFGTHWPNFLRSEPSENFRFLDRWESFFARIADTYGLMLSKDIAFAATQAQFRRHVKTRFADGVLTLDVSAVYGTGAAGLLDSFYLSFPREHTPLSCDGGTLGLYESHGDFNTYKITKRGDIVKIKF